MAHWRIAAGIVRFESAVGKGELLRQFSACVDPQRTWLLLEDYSRN